MKPNSFCTICTKKCVQELIGLLLSLSIHHTNEKIYILSDEETKDTIMKISPKIKLDIEWAVKLNIYSNYNRQQMVKKNIWNEFQMSKANVILYALEKSKDTLFLDSDMIILDTINDIDKTKDLGVSPQFIQQKNVDETGYYNGGMLWTKNKNVPEDWKKFTQTSRYHDQASIEDLVKKYSYFEFGENYNLQTWRFLLGLEPAHELAKKIKIKKNDIYLKDKKLKNIHTHFNEKRFEMINNFFKNTLLNAKRYKELLIINRVEKNNWIITIPKQPHKQHLYRHKNDSFRELAILLKLRNKDVELEYTVNEHVWLGENILLYDRPTLEWLKHGIKKTSLFLLGNGSCKIEGEILKKYKVNPLKPWIFWPRHPMRLEKILKEKSILSYEDRKYESVFIGNIENSIQNQYRNTSHDWHNVVDLFYLTNGNKHKFTQEEYLLNLRNSKYGLCLRGYGSKCHREVELMAFGTVPVVTPEVSITSYWEPLEEDIHYLYINNPQELKKKINEMTKVKWETMSKNCQEWYNRNVHSENCWNVMINRILYE